MIFSSFALRRALASLAIAAAVNVAPPTMALDTAPGSAAQRVFVPGLDEPLVATAGASDVEVAALLAAREAFAKRAAPEDVAALTGFMEAHPNSSYRLSVLTNLGLQYFRCGLFSRSVEAFEQAWAAGKAIEDGPAVALAGRAAGELAMMYARLGRYEDLKQLLEETNQRQFRGPGSNLLDDARSGFALMTTSPETSFKCGPYALASMLAAQKTKNSLPDALREARSTRDGMSMVEVRSLSKKVGLNLQPAHRPPGGQIVAPSVVHWKAGHYAAIVREENGRYLVKDPTFASRTDFWVTRETLDAEATGYMLVAKKSLPKGWRKVADKEAAKVWGKGQTGGNDGDRTGPNDDKGRNNGDPNPDPCKGMADWDVHTMLVSLNIMDTPLSYRPPVGPAMAITATYNSGENEAFAIPAHTNFGPKWLLNCLAYVQDIPESAAVVNAGYGGSQAFKWDPNTLGYERNKQSYAQIFRQAAGNFEVVWADGAREYYGLIGPNGLVYRTWMEDPAGNRMTFSYSVSNTDGTVRLTKITDAIGQETAITYEGGNLQPTKITDPFGRFCTFNYDSAGRLIEIVDPAGIRSQFAYAAAGDFINTLTTPYGQTKFERGSVSTTRWLQVTHPNGDPERFEYRHNAEGIAHASGDGPAGMLALDAYMNYRNALHWDRNAMKKAPGDVKSAYITHFLHTADGNLTSGLVESRKPPLESRIWYNYENQSDPIFAPPSGDERVTRIGRKLDDGTTQLEQMEYNAAGRIERRVDAAGRATSYSYDTNLRDVLQVRQETGASSYDTLATYTYNSAGLPLTSTDASGQTATLTYNERGQLLTISRPGVGTASWTYDGNGYLLSQDGPLSGSEDRLTYAYDAEGRIASVSDTAGLSAAYEYDNLDRVTRRLYPDGTSEEWGYDALSVDTYRSRSGRLVMVDHDPLGQITKISDSTGRSMLMDWCDCGGVSELIDQNGNMTRFSYDVQGRRTRKEYADGSAVQFLYEPMSGRLKKVVDEQGREQIFTYTADGRVTGLTFGGAEAATPGVTYSWDQRYPRLTGFTDTTGATAMTYRPVGAGQSGAGQLATIDGPLPNDTISLTYDSAGRITGRAINGVTETYSRDALMRLVSTSNTLGTFTQSYEGSSGRTTSIERPNGVTTSFTYHPVNSLKQLAEITNTGPGGLISKLAFGYDAALRLTRIQRTIGGAAALTDTAAFDASGRLTTYAQAAASGSTKNYAYSYDAVDNRVSETIDGITTSTAINPLNQLTSINPAQVAERTVSWDAAGRIRSIVQGTHESLFSYDALGRRVRILEKENGGTVADRRFIWMGLTPVEERDADGAVVQRFFTQGFQRGAASYFYTRDQIGSIREVIDSNGVVRARLDYDPYGRRTQVSGDIIPDFGFAGHMFHGPTQLVLTYGRAYDPALGRWLSRDPVGERTNANLYAYVGNPLQLTDVLGLEASRYTADQLAAGQQFGDYAFHAGSALLAGVGLGVAVAGVATAAPAVAVATILVAVPLGAYTVGSEIWNTWNAFNGYVPPSSGNFVIDFSTAAGWADCGMGKFLTLSAGFVTDVGTGKMLGAAAANVPGALANGLKAVGEAPGNFGLGVNYAPPVLEAFSHPVPPSPAPYQPMYSAPGRPAGLSGY